MCRCHYYPEQILCNSAVYADGEAEYFLEIMQNVAAALWFMTDSRGTWLTAAGKHTRRFRAKRAEESIVSMREI